MVKGDSQPDPAPAPLPGRLVLQCAGLYTHSINTHNAINLKLALELKLGHHYPWDAQTDLPQIPDAF